MRQGLVSLKKIFKRKHFRSEQEKETLFDVEIRRQAILKFPYSPNFFCFRFNTADSSSKFLNGSRKPYPSFFSVCR